MNEWTQQVAVVCDICRHTISNFQALLCLWIIKLQKCHLLPHQVPQFSRIWDSSSAHCKCQCCGQVLYHHTAQKFVAKLMRLIVHVYFNVMSGICCTNLFVYGRSFTLGKWQNLFIRIIQYQPQFVKLVIISALRIGLFVSLKCRQMYIFSNIFLRQCLSSDLCQHIIPQRSRALEGGVKELLIQMQGNFWVPCTVLFIGLYGLIWLLYKFVCSVNFCKQLFCKKKSTWKIDGEYGPPRFVQAISYFPWIWSQFPPAPHYTFIFWWRVFCIFLHCRMPMMCLELHNFRHLRCIPHHI